ncbi:MAG: hypothetical protein ACJART_001322 [Maribacter sp.]
MKRNIRNFLLVYALLWVLSFVVFMLLVSRGDREFIERVEFFIDIASNRNFLIGFHVVVFGCNLLLLAVQHFIVVFRTKGKTIFFKQFSYRFLLPILIAFIGVKTLIYANSNEWNDYQWDSSVMNQKGVATNLHETDNKQRGMSVFGWSEDNTEAINSLIKANVEWVAVVPFLYQEDEKTKVIDIPEFPEQYGRRDSSFIRIINEIHKKGLKVHLKPHLWMSSGWRSNVTLDNDKEWDEWFSSYRINMLRYARMAEITKTELFCIGTELRTSIKKQPDKWFQLITEVKKIYSGELTYAANWYDEYEHVPFWSELDYIGIQAYFPLTKIENPSLEAIENGWNKHIAAMELLHKKYQKPILFTEVGYKSESKATIKPWEWSSILSPLTRKKSDRTQQLAYEALFKKTWQQPWLSGIYVWEWNNRTPEESAKKDLDFSPRFKPAENTIAKWYGKDTSLN